MLRKMGVWSIVALALMVVGLFAPQALATCVGACFEIDDKETPRGTICYCKRSDGDAHCSCIEWTSNGEIQCLAYGACSYAP